MKNVMSDSKSTRARLALLRFSQTRGGTSRGAGAFEVALVGNSIAVEASPLPQAIDRCRFFDNRAVMSQKGFSNPQEFR
jgi:hypothetical protein